jgi:hypothetical protein
MGNRALCCTLFFTYPDSMTFQIALRITHKLYQIKNSVVHARNIPKPDHDHCCTRDSE